ncbi:U6 snRNA-associated Sm-like protein LSm2 [Protopterus annectens]|uniref:U6 snRNA-associated Sm-like protein LSm2 n=1 Tax=Protopterus annectens TaxID=7888 RepID=UPI001CF92F0A|nr:U6 snRNA-associated Sm-like protein LSm2 [Protopterus annectens]
MLFYSFFKSLVGKDVVVELKNDLSICGTLHSVDQYLNIKLSDISVTDPEKYPHMVSLQIIGIFFPKVFRCAVIVDDILVEGNGEAEHDRNLRKVLEGARDVNLKLNPEKYKIRLR